MKNKIKEILKKYLLKTDKIVVGVSGGADSIFLATILHELNYKTVIVHVNHNLRGDESDKEEIFVKQFANKLDIPIYKKKLTNSKSSEVIARDKRYKFLRKIKNKVQAKYILTAHHKNDLIETIIFNFLRGSGIRGLCGIKEINNDLLRPLLNISKKEIVNYCKKNNINYLDASDNFQPIYTRNKIRLNLIPEIENIFPSFEKTLHRNKEIYDDFQEYIDINISNWIKTNVKTCNNERIFSLNTFNKEPKYIQNEIIKYFFSQKQDINYKNILEIRNLLNKSITNKKKIIKGLVFEIEYDKIRIFNQKKTTKKVLKKTKITFNGTIKIIDKLLKTHTDKNNIYITYNKKSLSIPLSKLSNKTLFFRSRKEGDKIKIKNGSKKLKKIFIDNKITQRDRPYIPIIVDEDDNIIAISTLKLSNDY